jgi:hypothetical protein
VSYNDYNSTMVSQLTAVIANNPSVAERQAACEVLSKLSWIRRTLTPAAAALLDAVLAAAASAGRTGLTGKWIDKIDRHSYDRPFPPSTQVPAEPPTTDLRLFLRERAKE